MKENNLTPIYGSTYNRCVQARSKELSGGRTERGHDVASWREPNVHTNTFGRAPKQSHQLGQTIQARIHITYV